MTDSPEPREGETWHRIGGRERVRIDRVWTLSDTLNHTEERAVRCHPLHGGKWWWTVVPEFLARFEPETATPCR